MQAGAQKGNSGFDQECSLSLCTAGGSAEMPREPVVDPDPRTGETPSHAHRTQEAWPKGELGWLGQASRRIKMRMRLGEKIQVQKWGRVGMGGWSRKIT